MATETTITLDTTGQGSSPIKIFGGDYLLIVRATPNTSPASAFGGTTVTLQWREKDTDEWVTLQEDGSSKEITEDYNSLMGIPGGELNATATGGSGFSVNLEVYKVRR